MRLCRVEKFPQVSDSGVFDSSARTGILERGGWQAGDEAPVLQGFKAELFKALGHPVRIRILELLRDGERTVSEWPFKRNAAAAPFIATSHESAI